MISKKKIICLIIFVLFWVSVSHCLGSWLIYHKPEFKGKVIDAETKEPIEGAVVVAVYEKHSLIGGPGGGYTSVIKVKEVLTDRNGEFLITSYTTMIQPNSIEDAVQFIIYKPGYKSSAEFTIWALPEGLAFPSNFNKFSLTLKNRVDDKWKQEFEDYLKTLPEKDRARTQRGNTMQYINLYVPIFLMKNSKEKLQRLDIPFFQIPNDIDLVAIKWDYELDVYDLDEKSGYKVVGLPKAKNREERLRAMPSTPTDIGSKELPILYKIMNEENKRFGLGEEK